MVTYSTGAQVISEWPSAENVIQYRVAADMTRAKYLGPKILRRNKRKARRDTSISTSQDTRMAAVRRCYRQVRSSPGLKEKTADRVKAREKKKVDSCAAIGALADMAATH